MKAEDDVTGLSFGENARGGRPLLLPSMTEEAMEATTKAHASQPSILFKGIEVKVLANLHARCPAL